jgi:hypothetical protein
MWVSEVCTVMWPVFCDNSMLASHGLKENSTDKFVTHVLPKIATPSLAPGWDWSTTWMYNPLRICDNPAPGGRTRLTSRAMFFDKHENRMLVFVLHHPCDGFSSPFSPSWATGKDLQHILGSKCVEPYVYYSGNIFQSASTDLERHFLS